jgi:hypothetical protein
MCNAIEESTSADWTQDLSMRDRPELNWTRTYRDSIEEYFIKMRTEEWEQKAGLRDDDGKQLT